MTDGTSRPGFPDGRDDVAPFRGLAPGWYRDLSDPTVARYWSGESLSAERRPIPRTAVRPAVSASRTPPAVPTDKAPPPQPSGPKGSYELPASSALQILMSKPRQRAYRRSRWFKNPRYYVAGIVVLILAVIAVGVTAKLKTKTPTTPSGGSDDELTAWCSLVPLDPQAEVLSQMGQPDGEEATGVVLPSGYTLAVWNAGNDRLVATFSNGRVSELLAYSGTIGGTGAANIGCAAFRT